MGEEWMGVNWKHLLLTKPNGFVFQMVLICCVLLSYHSYSYAAFLSYSISSACLICSIISAWLASSSVPTLFCELAVGCLLTASVLACFCKLLARSKSKLVCFCYPAAVSLCALIFSSEVDELIALSFLIAGAFSDFGEILLATFFFSELIVSIFCCELACS